MSEIRKLSKRETQILKLIKEGLKNQEIASQLGLSCKTIENHIRSIMVKLEVSNRTAAVIVAIRQSMIDV